MRLALSEGRLSRWKELRHELTPRELTELIAFSLIEPWGDRRADIREALMAAVIASSFGGEKVDLDRLTNYMESDQSEESSGEFQSPNAAAAMMTQTFPSLTR